VGPIANRRVAHAGNVAGIDGYLGTAQIAQRASIRGHNVAAGLVLERVDVGVKKPCGRVQLVGLRDRRPVVLI